MLVYSAGSANPYLIKSSLAFDAASGLSKTLTVGGNQKKFTLSFWTKGNDITSWQPIISFNTSATNVNSFKFLDGALVYYLNNGTAYTVTSSSFLRDPNAWYHIVLTIDTAQTTDTNRVKIYVNGALIANKAGSTYPPQNTNQLLNGTGTTQYVNTYDYATSTQYYNASALFAEINFVDDAALSASSFGYFSSSTNQWQPTKYTGSYGTTGYYLTLASGQASGYGTDSSGLGNNWTEVASGFTSSVDTPVVGIENGKIYGNYANINSLQGTSNLSKGGTKLSQSVTGIGRYAEPSIGFGATGSYYVEMTYTSVVSLVALISLGVGTAISTFTPTNGVYRSNGNIYDLSGVLVTTAATYTVGDIIGVVVDQHSQNVYFYKNGVAQGSFSTTGVELYLKLHQIRSSGSSVGSTILNFNFGQYAYTYTPTQVSTPLCAYTKPLYAISNPSQFFNAILYTGDGTTSRTILQNGNFTPNLFWVKRRDLAVGSNYVFDTVRGVGTTALKTILTESTALQDGTLPASGNATAFTGTGLTVATGATNNQNLNYPLAKYVAWVWKESVSAGLDIVSYVGNGTSQTISHNLAAVPQMIIVKKLIGAVSGWPVYLDETPGLAQNNEYLLLNTTANPTTDTTVWNGTFPTTTGFTVGTSALTNTNLADYIAYVFAEKTGFSKFGQYFGTGDNLTGDFIYCNFTPRYILIKSTQGTAYSWVVLDSSRSTYNVLGEELYPNTTAIGVTAVDVDFLCNGFKIRGTSAYINGVAGTLYSYVAFAENPFNYTNAR